MNSTTCHECSDCQHRIVERGEWCYMFFNRPENLPCAQHDKFKVERAMVSACVRKHPVLPHLMVLAETAKL